VADPPCARIASPAAVARGSALLIAPAVAGDASAAAMVYEGPGLGAQIVRGLERLMRRDGFASIAEAVGSE
jgi:hypothetical protein